MGPLVLLVTAAIFEAVFANRQRAMVLVPEPALRPGGLVEVTDGKRRCERIITDVTGYGIPELAPFVLVSLRPLTGAEKSARTPGEGPA